MTPFRESLANAANEEWERWGGSIWRLGQAPQISGKETDEKYWRVVTEYWRAVDRNSTNHGRDGVAWSGVFISFCFAKAGAGDNFPYSSNHSIYMSRADSGRFPSLQVANPVDTPIEVGDLVWNPRTGGNCMRPPITYSAARSEMKKIRDNNYKSGFCSHCDIVVSVRDGKADTIGGNMSDSVRKTTWVINERRCISDGRQNWIGILKNNI